MRIKGTKLILTYLWISIRTLDTNRNPWVVLYPHIDQQITHTTNVYVAAAAHLATMLLSLLACCRR